MSRNKYPEETKKLIIDVSLKLFLEKGYENTSVQDIIDSLGGLSKGAIYHHFKSKEEILNAVKDRIISEGMSNLQVIRDDNSLNGYEKLKKLSSASFNSSYHEMLFNVSPNFKNNPRLLSMHIKDIFNTIAPKYIEPVVKEGIEDGSIVTEYPKELSETIVLMSNVWLNPMIVDASNEEMINKARFFQFLLRKMNIDLIDDQMIEKYCEYCKLYNLK